MREKHGLGEVSTAALADFVLLSELRSFQRTADHQGISQPALSRRVQALEKAVGASLIDRRSQPIQLSRAGKALLPFVRESLTRLSEGAEFFKGTISDLQDPVTFVATHTLAISFFPEWIKSQGINLGESQIVMNAFRTERCFEELKAGRADLGLCLLPEGDEEVGGLEGVQIASDALVPVVAPSLAKSQGRKGNGSRSFLSYAPGSPISRVVGRVVGRVSVNSKVKLVFESPSSEVLKSMVVAGHGIAYLPKMLIRQELKSKLLVEVGEEWESVPLKVFLVRGATPSSPLLEAVWKAA